MRLRPWWYTRDALIRACCETFNVSRSRNYLHRVSWSICKFRNCIHTLCSRSYRRVWLNKINKSSPITRSQRLRLIIRISKQISFKNSYKPPSHISFPFTTKKQKIFSYFENDQWTVQSLIYKDQISSGRESSVH